MLAKKNIVYWFIFFACISAYFISKRELVQKDFRYSSTNASDVYIVWGLMDKTDLSTISLPANSYLQDGMIFTRMSCRDTSFFTSLTLPVNTNIYYWIVLRKDNSGNDIDIWDSGGDKAYYNRTFTSSRFFKPGYFILLAGLFPLLLHYLINRNKIVNSYASAPIKIAGYIHEFDALRAIAVLLVIIHHWLPEKFFLNALPNGAIGVNVFFVLSGFLITGILLKSRKQIESEIISRGAAFKNFYIRRTLRIFPIYYLLLMIFWLIKDPNILQNGIYYTTYTSNFLFYFQQGFPGRLSHLWSLAVEEQFYIFWPWLIILINKKLLPYLIALFIVIGVSSNYIFINNGWWGEILTQTCFDAFAIGGFLSYLIYYRQDVILKIQPIFRWLFLISLALFLLQPFGYEFLPKRTIQSLFAVCIIYYSLFKKNYKAINLIFDSKWLIQLGKISYGIYLYHLFVPELWLWIIKKFEVWGFDFFYNKATPEFLKPTWLFIQHFSFLLLICSISWKLIEQPFNKLKSRFELKRIQ